MTDPRSFGEWLRRERERRGVTVHAIADRTKIGPERLRSLERGDVSMWPGGIYRRAFVRSYADAVGLDADDVLATFEQLFPDPDAPATPDTPAPASGFRLQLAASPSRAGQPWMIALRDVTAALAAGALGFVVAGALGFWCALAATALGLHVWMLFRARPHVTVTRESPEPVREPVAETLEPRRLAPIRFETLEARSHRSFIRRRPARQTAPAQPH